MHTLHATRWQYRTLKIDVFRSLSGPRIDEADIGGRLDQLGGEGWELVSVVGATAGQGGTCDLVAIFKRPAC